MCITHEQHTHTLWYLWNPLRALIKYFITSAICSMCRLSYERSDCTSFTPPHHTHAIKTQHRALWTRYVLNMWVDAVNFHQILFINSTASNAQLHNLFKDFNLLYFTQTANVISSSQKCIDSLLGWHNYWAGNLFKILIAFIAICNRA